MAVASRQVAVFQDAQAPTFFDPPPSYLEEIPGPSESFDDAPSSVVLGSIPRRVRLVSIPPFKEEAVCAPAGA